MRRASTTGGEQREGREQRGVIHARRLHEAIDDAPSTCAAGSRASIRATPSPVTAKTGVLDAKIRCAVDAPGDGRRRR